MKFENLQDEVKNKIVFAVGNNIYTDKNYPKLKKCENDAEGIYNLFLDKKYLKGVKEQSILLTSGNYDISKELFMNKLREIINCAKIDDQLIIYFSGHGEQVEGEFALVLCDTVSCDANTYIRISEIEDALSACVCKTKIAIFDACYSGTDLIGSKSIRPTKKTMEELIRESRGMIILSSSTANQPSNQKSPSCYSLFTHFLIEGMSGNAIDISTSMMDLYECYKYAAHKMQDYARSAKLDSQIPAINMVNEGILYLGCFLENDESYIWFEDNYLRIDIREIPNESSNYFEKIYACMPEELFDLLKSFVFEVIHNAFRHGMATKAEIYISKNEIKICENGNKFDLLKWIDMPMGGGSFTAKEIKEQEYFKSVEYSFLTDRKLNQYKVSFNQERMFDIRFWTIANPDKESEKCSFSRVCKYYFWNEKSTKSPWKLPISLNIRDILQFERTMSSESILFLADNSSLVDILGVRGEEIRIVASEEARKYMEKYTMDYI